MVQMNPMSNQTPASRHSWLASLLLQRNSRVMSRFFVACSRLKGLGRSSRRRLRRTAAAGWIALALTAGSIGLQPPAAHAASITVDGTTCTLVDAIRAANMNAAVNGCASGAAGVDTIDLQADTTLTASFGNYYDSDTGLPLVTEDLILSGNGHAITRDATADPFRILAIADSLTVTINDTTISGGNSQSTGGGIYADEDVTLTLNNAVISGNRAGLETDTSPNYTFYNEGYGGGIFQDGGTLTIIDSEITGNTADSPDCFYNSYNQQTYCYYSNGKGGGIFLDIGDLTVTDSTVSGNTAVREGGGLYFNSEPIYGGPPNYDYLPSTDYALITGSRFEGNYSGEEGGAIYHDGGTMRIERSVISGNTADQEGGGIYVELGPLYLIDSIVSDNTAGNEGGGIYTDGPLTLSGTTVSGNEAGSYGGGIHVDDAGTVEIVNSTISNNTATTDNGGGINFDSADADNRYGFLSNTITHTTLTGNTAGGTGGGVALVDDYYSGYAPVAVLERTIVSGNTAGGAGDEIDGAPGNVTADEFNVLGDSGKNNADAFNNFTPGASDITATSDGTNPTAIGGILNTTLADNGGPTLTHLLVDLSPALDTAPDGPAADQRGGPRPLSAAFDSGAVEGTTPLGVAVFMSTRAAGTTVDGLAFGSEDIIKWDGSAWSMWFDGSAAGLAPVGKWKHDINAFYIPDPNSDEVILSFTQNRRLVPDIVDLVNGMDLVRWDGSAFSLWFDGEDVGLTQMTQEKIDSLHVLPGSASPIGGSCLNYLLISTQGTGRVANHDGTSLRFRGEDVLGFCLTNAGPSTTGFWHMVLDGSAQGMPPNATDSISLSADGQTMYLTTRRTFNVDSASGGHSMVYAYDFATQSFSGPVFIAADNGLPKTVDGLQME